ncbi:hypothetical protein RvY_06386 [Ramazzottius varieornatus]|uniref:long-chain-fatty-acid--CoA ligase n=1 Tax=Ramazzottius varieornatus TaxID=947166 RepID=A0A1D1UYB7_RAMVA|nr:hypothetical protein RvY_06386 [Ramazzottius varieornatus]
MEVFHGHSFDTPQTLACVVCGAAALLWFYFKRQPRLRAKGLDYANQSVVVGDRFESQQGVRRRNFLNGRAGESIGFEWPETIWGFMARGIQISGNGPCLGFRRGPTTPYEWISYYEVEERIKALGAGLIQLGLRSHNDSQSFVGIFAKTSPEWVITEYATYAYNLVLVPFYDSLGAEACRSALNRLKISVLICGTVKSFEPLLHGTDGLSRLKTVIFLEEVTEEARQKYADLGLKVLTLGEVENLGRKYPAEVNPPKKEDLAILMFTSGTTGEPKAAMLTHETVAQAIAHVDEGLLPTRLDSKTTSIAYLPLAHIMERIVEMSVFVRGGRVGFNSNGIPRLVDDIQELKPDLVVLVPRILYRIYGKMTEAARQSPLKRAVLNLAIFFKSLEMKYGIYRRDSIWDKLVFGKLQDSLGGNVRICATGSAPLDPHMTNAMRAALGCYIFEVYGQTETAGVITGTLAGDAMAGHAGAPAIGMEVKLVDVPELGYLACQAQGEVCARGPHVMKGYYGMPSETAETIDQEGFVHTGDIGQWIKGGRLKIIDRKKYIFKLSQGEYVAPEKLENDFLTSSLFAQIFIDGSSLYPFTVALVHPNMEHPLLKETMPNGGGDYSRQASVQAILLKELETVGKSKGISSFQIPKKIYILPQAFSVENGFMTPTQKMKRAVVRKAFKEQLDAMYKNVSLFD